MKRRKRRAFSCCAVPGRLHQHGRGICLGASDGTVTYVQRIALSQIESNHTYAVQARVEVEGRLRFINNARYADITRGELTHVDLVLKAVGGPAAE